MVGKGVGQREREEKVGRSKRGDERGHGVKCMVGKQVGQWEMEEKVERSKRGNERGPGVEKKLKVK